LLVNELQSRLEKLENQSSEPPSFVKPDKKKRRRKLGQKPGHKGYSRPIPDHFDEEVDPLREIIAQGDQKCIDTFYSQAEEKFRQAGLKESQIEINQVKSTINIGKTIVTEAEKGNYGTIIVGRRGANNSFFMGSVSRHILTNASDCAVWLVP